MASYKEGDVVYVKFNQETIEYDIAGSAATVKQKLGNKYLITVTQEYVVSVDEIGDKPCL